MPRERIYTGKPFYQLPDGGEVYCDSQEGDRLVAEKLTSNDDTYWPVNQHGLELSWNREGWVELGATKFSTATGDRLNNSPGFYVGLNRSEINDLIRKLRRARDHAFGSDA